MCEMKSVAKVATLAAFDVFIPIVRYVGEEMLECSRSGSVEMGEFVSSKTLWLYLFT